jgi:predicted nucleic acid-binding protein
MSAAVFADTFYFLALLNTAEAAHELAVTASCVTGRKFLTTEFVLVELADALSRPQDRAEFFAVWEAIGRDGNFRVVSASSALLQRGLALYQARMDKEWSLTDCISFVVMQEENLREALTGGRHFEQAGFIALLAER